MKDIQFSRFTSHKASQSNVIGLSDYVTYIKTGINREDVEIARGLKNKGNKEAYAEMKVKTMCISAHSVMKPTGTASKANIDHLNGILIIDIDDPNVTEEQYSRIRNDRYTLVMHASFGGVGKCIFVKIKPELFRESYDGLAEYYFKNFGVFIGVAEKNENRLRAISYDPDIFVNEKAITYVAKPVKKKEFVEPKILYVQDDFEYIIQQIKSRCIDICRDEYDRFMRVGFSIFNHFGTGGLDIFKVICSYGTKFEPRKIEQQYKGFGKGTGSGVTIATFYYFCKEEGIEIYTSKTKDTIRAVKIYKSQGKASVETVSKHLTTVNGHESPDTALIQKLIDSKTDYEVTLPKEGTQIDRITTFLKEVYKPFFNSFSIETYITNNRGNVVKLSDYEFDSIFCAARKYFDGKVDERELRAVLNSDLIETYDPINDFLKNLPNDVAESEIDSFFDCLECTQSQEFVRKFSKKWLVGWVHNLTAHIDCDTVSPLTLVLCGSKHGTGKTTFIRHMVPQSLKEYISGTTSTGQERDEKINLATAVLVFDDEFGSMNAKESEAFKKYSDYNCELIRPPHGKKTRPYKRRAGIAGTSNKDKILKDPTGNRRIIPLNIIHIRFDDFKSFDSDRLFAWAYATLKENPDYFKIYGDEIMTELAENTISNVEHSPLTEIFEQHFQIEESETFSEKVILNMGEVLQYLLTHTAHKYSKHDISDVFFRLKLDYKPHKINGILKRGVKLFKKYDGSQTIQNAPF